MLPDMEGGAVWSAAERLLKGLRGKLLELAERCSLYRPTLPKTVSGGVFHRVFSGVSFNPSLRKATESG